MEHDWIEISLRLGAIIVPSVVAWLIGNTIKNKLDNKKSLRDHILREILEIRNNYRQLLDSVRIGTIKPKVVKNKLSVFSIRITDLMKLIKKGDNDVSKDFLLPYQLDFSQLITEDDNFILKYKDNEEFTISDVTYSSLLDFENKNNHLFNDLILAIFE